MALIVSHTQPTRSVYQPRIFICGTLILLTFFLTFVTVIPNVDISHKFISNGIEDIGDLSYPKQPKSSLNGSTDFYKAVKVNFLNLEMETPLNSLFNLFFPIDSIISYNTTDSSRGVVNHQSNGRYASFSAILASPLLSKYRILPNNACDPNFHSHLELAQFYNKTLIVLRGECTFVDKVRNIVNSGLNPTSILVANDEPYGGLITMYSNNFNLDGSIRIPIMFIANEDYRELSRLQRKNLDLEISTASLGSWFGILLSMIVSPPLIIIIFYLLIICAQKLKRRQVNIRNARLVKSLPVFIYNGNHLIDANHFETYLRVTRQSNIKHGEHPILDSPKLTPSSSSSHLNKIVVNGIDIKLIARSLHILTSPSDFYPSYKCSICLDRYIPLHTRVLVLECKHFYHDKCLSNWLINFRRSCPLCNRTLSSYDNYRISGGSQYGSLDDFDDERLVESSASMESESQNQVYENEITETARPVLSMTQPLLNGITHATESSSNAVSTNDSHAIDVSTSESMHSEGTELYSTPSNATYITAPANDPRSDASFYLASSDIQESVSVNQESRRHFYSKPSHILSQFTASNRNIQDTNDTSFSGYSDLVDSHLNTTTTESESDEDTIQLP